MNSSQQRVCSDCGAELAADHAASTCARCLVEACFHEESVYGAPESAGTLPSSLAAPGEVFGDYELQEEIARGGMGVVFKARQRSLDRTVALKMMLPGWLSNRETVRRFRIEAEAASRLMHPGIVAIHDVGECEGQHFYSMDYIEGLDLVRRVENGLVSPELAARWIRSVAVAIHHAHQHGILHRDLKPANILIDAQDEPHVTDFGLAKLLDAARDLTVTGRVLGTPSFMPPEQADPERGEVTVASDVYGLGAILYFLLTGRAPFEGTSTERTITLLLTEDPVPPSRLRAGIPRDLETICLKCLSREPPRRYASAAELADDLGAWSRHEPIRARPVARTERLWFWARRNPWLAGVSGALILTAVIGVPVQQHLLNEARRARAAAEGLIQFMNEDLTEQLRPLGRLRLLDNVNRTVQQYYQGVHMKEKPSDPRAGKVQFYKNNASVLRELGRVDEAQESARSAIALLEPLVRQEPDNPDWPASLAEAHAQMRNILADIEPSTALQPAQEAVRYYSHASERTPASLEILVKLANARLEFCSVLQRQKKTQEAEEEIRRATELLNKAPGTGTNASGVQAQLALSRYYQGLIEMDRGNQGQARASFAEYLEKTEQLARDAAEPADAQVLHSVTVAHSYVGQALFQMKDFPAAASQFRKYLELAEKLERLDPGNMNYRLELGLSLNWLASALDESGGAAEEITSLRTRSLKCSQKLANDFPQGDVWQENAFVAVACLADWFSRRTDPERACQLYADELNRQWNVLLKFNSRRAQHNRFLKTLDYTNHEGRSPDESNSDQVARLQSWTEKVAKEAAKPGAHREWNWTLAMLHSHVAIALALKDKFDEAKRELEAALLIWQRFVREQPSDWEAAAELARTLCRINIATARDGTAPVALGPLIEWLKTRGPAAPGGDAVLQVLGPFRSDLKTAKQTWTPAEQASLNELDQVIEKLKASVSAQPAAAP